MFIDQLIINYNIANLINNSKQLLYYIEVDKVYLSNQKILYLIREQLTVHSNNNLIQCDLLVQLSLQQIIYILFIYFQYLINKKPDEKMQDELMCAICEEEYSENKLPRLMPKCGHSYCEFCVLELFNENNGNITIVCPQDEIQMIVPSKSIVYLPISVALIELFEQRLLAKSKKINATTKQNQIHPQNKLVDTSTEDTNQLIECIHQSKTEEDYTKNNFINITLNNQICLVHSKAFEIMCINCQINICTECALFGKHKGHDFKSLKEVQVNINEEYKQLMELYEKSLKFINDITNPTNLDKFNQNLEKKKKEMVSQINKKFEDLIKIILAQKQKCFNKLQVQISTIKDKYTNQFKTIYAKQNIYSQWSKSTNQIISTTQQNKKISSTVAQKFKEFIKEGKPIILELEKINEYLDTQRTILSNSLNIKFNRDIENHIKDFMKIQPQVKIKNFKDFYQTMFKPDETKKNNEQPSSTQHVNEELLIDDFHNKKKQEQPQIFIPLQKIKFSMSYNQLPDMHKNTSQKLLATSSISQIKQKDINKSGQVSKQQALSNLLNPDLRKTKNDSSKTNLKETSFMSTSQIFQKSNGLLKKKTPIVSKIKLPEKYQKILEAILADQLEVLDLTNAQLGDQVINEIICLISDKIKTIKLIRNKITDEGFIKIVPFLKNITTLNLAQNLLTDKAIDILKENMSKMPYLRNLVLSQNRIKERNVKVRVEQIKKYNVIVSL